MLNERRRHHHFYFSCVRVCFYPLSVYEVLFFLPQNLSLFFTFSVNWREKNDIHTNTINLWSHRLLWSFSFSSNRTISGIFCHSIAFIIIITNAQKKLRNNKTEIRSSLYTSHVQSLSFSLSKVIFFRLFLFAWLFSNHSMIMFKLHVNDVDRYMTITEEKHDKSAK